MKCNNAKELLSAYQDARVSSEEESEIKAHLAVCPACQKEYELLSKAWTAINVLRPIQPSPDFKARFWQKVREEETVTEDWRKVLAHLWERFAGRARPAFVVVSFILVALLGTMVALNFLPLNYNHRDASPILQWAQGMPKNIQTGGFLL